MNLEEHASRIEQQYKIEKELLKAVVDLDIVDDVGHISSGTIFITDRSFDENMSLLTKIRKTYDLTLNTYFMSTGRLATRYIGKDVAFLFLSSDAVNALERVSGGKCKIETRAHEEQEVVCSVGGAA